MHSPDRDSRYQSAGTYLRDTWSLAFLVQQDTRIRATRRRCERTRPLRLSPSPLLPSRTPSPPPLTAEKGQEQPAQTTSTVSQRQSLSGLSARRCSRVLSLSDRASVTSAPVAAHTSPLPPRTRLPKQSSKGVACARRHTDSPM